MMQWWVVNLDTGETRRVRAYDAESACVAAGWRSEYCDARIVPPLSVATEAHVAAE